MTSYGVGIIGTGWVAGPYAEAFQQHPQTIVKAICSREEERGKAFVKKLDLSGCQIYTDYEKMLRDPEVDIVVICTPNALHAEQTIAAAQEKKPIIIEKPIALTWSDMQAMHKAVKEAGVKTIVGFVLRWHPLFVTLKELMTQQALGKLFYAEADYYHEVRPGRPNLSWIRTRSMGGTALLSAGCHAVDAVHYFVEDEVIEVFAYATRNHPLLEYESTIVTLLKFQHGALAKIGCSREMRSNYVFNIALYGDKGSVRNNQLYPGHLSQIDQFITLPVPVPDSGDTAHHPFLGEISHFVECLTNNVESHCNLEDALKTHEICLAADRSAAEGKPISLPLERA